MAFTLGGLATGLDTNSLIKELMNAQRQPIKRLQNDKSFHKTRLTAYTDFDKKLKDLLAKAEAMETSQKFLASKATPSSKDYFGVTATTTAPSGNYNIEVVSLAKQEREVAAGVADGFTSAGGELTINGKTVNITAGSTLEQIRGAINSTADIGVSASIINDGTGTPHRLVFTANQAGVNGVDISANTTDLAFTSQAGSLAQVKVDGIDIFRTSNTVADAIPGVTLDLVKMNPLGETTSLKVETDQDAVKQKLKDFVKSYNDIVSFIGNQKDASWGRDSGLQLPKTRLQNLLTTAIGGSGTLQSLSQLGLETQKDGTVVLNDAKLSKTLTDNLADVTSLLTGVNGGGGIVAKFKTYLKGVTDRVDGLLPSRKKSTEASVKRIDNSIEKLEMRLAQREKSMRAQFEALETLTSAMNSQGAFLANQINAWNRN
ncbi:MAG: flagellar filament capping protein FliD [Trichloromonadaceae bacterium]